jgi:LEA14-like dessication related protein
MIQRTEMRRARKILVLLALFCALSGWSQSKSLQDDLKISLNETKIRDFSMDGLTFVFSINISNSSSSAYFLSGYEYRFVVNQMQYFHLQIPLEKKIMIAAKKSKTLSFPIKITYAHLFRLVKGIETEDQVEGTWSGTMTFADKRKERGRLSFSFSGHFPIFQKPQIEFRALRVKELTIGGADVIFDAGFGNPNVFAFTVERISYEYYLRNSLIIEESVTKGKAIASHGETAFSLPILMNFFEVGKDVYTHLQRSSTLCRFTGEIEVKTEWGRVKIPFDKTGRITISRTS